MELPRQRYQVSARKEIEATIKKLDLIFDTAMKEYQNCYDADDKQKYLLVAAKVLKNRAKIIKEI